MPINREFTIWDHHLTIFYLLSDTHMGFSKVIRPPPSEHMFDMFIARFLDFMFGSCLMRIRSQLAAGIAASFCFFE